MLNAAVAAEAFDPTGGVTQEFHDNMTPQAWTNYADRIRASHWGELFPSGDGRRLLTWKGRFLNVTNIVNFYSSNGAVVATNYHYRAEMLAYTIPAESYAVGANPLPGREDVSYMDRDKAKFGSYNMAVLFDIGTDDLPANGTRVKDMHRNWQHSTFVQRSYKRVHQLFKKVTQLTKESQK